MPRVESIANLTPRETMRFFGEAGDWARLLKLAPNRAIRRRMYHAYLESTAWKRKREAAGEAAGWRCEKCNALGYQVGLALKRFEVHHTTYERVGDEDPSDLVFLCHRCHRELHATNPPTR